MKMVPEIKLKKRGIIFINDVFDVSFYEWSEIENIEIIPLWNDDRTKMIRANIMIKKKDGGFLPILFHYDHGLKEAEEIGLTMIKLVNEYYNKN
jgi:hypothetical protein